MTVIHRLSWKSNKEFNSYLYTILNSLKLLLYPPHLPRTDDKFVVQFHYVVYLQSVGMRRVCGK